LIYRWDENVDFDDYGSKYRVPGNIEMGKSYWIVLLNNAGKKTNLSINGNIELDTVTISLTAGWNQIGNPFPYTVNWKDCFIIFNGNSLTPEMAETENIIQNKIYWYFKSQASVYQPNNIISYEEVQLKPWFGNWIYAHKNCELIIPPVYSIPNDTNLQNTPIKLSPALVNENDWEINLKVVSAALKDEYNFIGVRSNAVDGQDNNDVFEAPLVNDYVNLSFEQQNLSKKTVSLFTTDYKSKIETYKTWNFKVKTTLKNEAVTIDVSNMKLPNDYVAYFFDNKTGDVLDLLLTKNFVYNSGNDSIRNFSIKVGKSEYASLMLAAPGIDKKMSCVYPSPAYINRISGNYAGYPKFLFVTEDGAEIIEIDIKIFDLSGKKVRNLNISDVTKTENNGAKKEIQWNCLNGKGKKVGSGTYLAVIKITDINKNKFKLNYKFSIIR
jgi:hypothetical protein